MLFALLGDNLGAFNDLAFLLRMRWPDADVQGVPGVGKLRDLLESQPVDLLFVDGTVPGEDILQLLEQVRSFSDVPIILLGRNTSDVDRARGLEYGADDTFEWPGSTAELLARAKSVMRRARGQGFRAGSPVVALGQLSINPSTAEVLLGGLPIPLTPIEFRLLTTLARNQGRVVSNQLLLERVWGGDYMEEAGFIKTYVYRLRRKLENGSGLRMIITERGHGYKFVAPLQDAQPPAPSFQPDRDMAVALA